MKKILLTIMVLGSTLSMVGCGSSGSSGGGNTAVAPVTTQSCAATDPVYGCLQPSSACVPGQANCIAVNQLNAAACEDRCDGQSGYTRIHPGPGGCVAQNGCGACAAMVNGQCQPGIVEFHHRHGYLRSINGQFFLESIDTNGDGIPDTTVVAPVNSVPMPPSVFPRHHRPRHHRYF